METIEIIELFIKSFKNGPPPLIQVFLLFMFGATWLGGMKILCSIHLKRINANRTDKLDRSDLVYNLFNTFNYKEWLALILIFIISFSFGILSISYEKFI